MTVLNDLGQTSVLGDVLTASRCVGFAILQSALIIKIFDRQPRAGDSNLSSVVLWREAGEGFKTIIPSVAWAKLSFRLVADQDPVRIARLVEDYFRSICPPSVKIEFVFYEKGMPYVCPITLPEYRAAEQAFIDTYGMQPIPAHSGCSISIVSDFEQELGIKTILMGFGLGADNIHAPNENFRIDRLFKGIETAVEFYKHYAQNKQ